MRRRSLSAPASGRSGKVFPNSRFGNSNNRPRGGNKFGRYIDPDKFVNKAIAAAEVVEFVPEHRFSDFGFAPALQRNVSARGYVTPTPIQDGAIKPAMAGRDVIGLANTGTGKTAAFMLPIIHQLLNNDFKGRALVMAPTRELAVQIEEELRGFAKGLPIRSAICVGGANMQRQISTLKSNPQIVIGTPGRLKDLLNQRALRLEQTNILVLDEADRMLDMGFIRDIRYILERLPQRRQSLCFSATITPDIQVLLDDMLTDPVTVSVRTSETSDHVEQDVVRAGSKEEKFDVLTELLDREGYDKVLIFGQTKWSVQRLADTLSKRGLSAVAIHGNKSQPQRQKALKAFKSGQASIMVATDVAARGLDIPNVSHVINFDQPATYEDYIHRIGRTGRAGNRGHALTFVTGR
jgi:ATP-dependent RNA helicase RhlE